MDTSNSSGDDEDIEARQRQVMYVKNQLRDPRRDRPCTIYRVPKHIRDCNPDAYVPEVLPIGPFHHHSQKVGPTGVELKRGFARLLIARYLRRHPDITDASLIEMCLKETMELVPRAWSCYSDKFLRYSYNDKQFAEMMFFDGCSILYLLLKQADNTRGEEEEDGGDRLMMGGKWSTVVYDLLLLENQMPFFVVRKLFELLRTPDDAKASSLVDLALKLFRNLYPRLATNRRPIPEENVHHLLHIFYLSLLPLPPWGRCDSVPPTPDSEWIPCVSELRENGIKFAKKTDETNGFLDVTFHDSTVEIPPLHLFDYSESLFRNLVAFEQCYPDIGNHITLYAAFIDLLLSSPADARLLQHKGILVNCMITNRKGSDLFRRVCEQVHHTSDANYLRSVFVEVNRCYQSRRQRWQARLLREYCGSPWMIVSVVAASVLLLAAVAQTFYAIYSYYHHRN